MHLDRRRYQTSDQWVNTTAIELQLSCVLLDRVSPRPSEGSSWSGLPPLCCAHDKTVYAWTSDPLVRLYSGRKHLLLLARIPVEHTINDSLSNGRKVEPDAVVVPSSSFQLSPGSSGFIAMCSVEPYTMEPPKYEVMTLICFLCTLLRPSKREEAPVPHAALEQAKGRQVLLIRRSLLDTGMGKHGASLWHMSSQLDSMVASEMSNTT